MKTKSTKVFSFLLALLMMIGFISPNIPLAKASEDNTKLEFVKDELTGEDLIILDEDKNDDTVIEILPVDESKLEKATEVEKPYEKDTKTSYPQSETLMNIRKCNFYTSVRVRITPKTNINNSINNILSNHVNKSNNYDFWQNEKSIRLY